MENSTCCTNNLLILNFIFVMIVLCFSTLLNGQERSFNQVSSKFNGIDIGSYIAVTTTDIDRDNKLDLIVGANDQLYHYEQDAVNSLNFSAQVPALLQTSGGTDISFNNDGSPYFIDLDNDGLLDLLVGVDEYEGILHYEQTSSGALTFDYVREDLVVIEDGYGYNRIWLGHLDNNNKIDLLIGNYEGTVYHAEQTAVNSNSFNRLTTYFNSINVSEVSSPAVADFYDDGILDLLIGERVTENAQYYIADAANSLNFNRVNSTFLGSTSHTELVPHFCDLDNDNLIDLLVGHQAGEIYYYEAVFEVITYDPTNVLESSAELQGLIGYDDSNITKGFVWSTSANPDLTDNVTDQGSGAGSYSTTISGLTRGTTYYYRAYTTIGGTTTYGNEISFETDDIPRLTTRDAFNIRQDQAESGGIINDKNGADITAKGLCWSTSSNPTILDFRTNEGEHATSFYSTMTGLNRGTTYYVRAYATNAVGTGYGLQKEFTTDDVPSLTTTTATSITTTTAESGGEVTDDNGSAVTARGLCWGTNSNPTTADNTTSDGSGTGAFTSSLTGLTQGETYYYRSYATNGVGTGYGDEQNFTTDDVPDVTTYDVEAVGLTSAVGKGNVTSENGKTVTERGICWSTSSNPTTSDSKLVCGSGKGEFEGNITGLQKDNRYYIRAYAINSVGTNYGQEKEILTPVLIRNSLHFAGDDEYLSNNLTLPETGTIETWVNHPNNISQKLIQASDNSSDWYFNITGGGGGYNVKIGNSSVANTDFFTSNTWHHFAVTWIRNAAQVTVQLYVDGNLKDVANNLWTAPGSSMDIGAFNGTSSFYHGQLDEFRIWNYAKSGAEILLDMHRMVEPNSAGLICYYTFDSAGDTQVSDQSGNGNHATAHNIINSDWVTTTAPIGEDGQAVRSTSQTNAGNPGSQIQATMSNNPNDSRYLGIYCYGDGSEIINAETFPAGITQRPSILWGWCGVGSAEAELIFEYDNIPGIADDSALKLLRRQDANDAWEVYDTPAFVQHDVNANTFTILNTNELWEYTIADGGTNPLPVELVSFTAQTVEGGVELKWQTATEINNYGFQVERQKVKDKSVTLSEVEVWESIGFAEGHGNSNSPMNYEYIDNQILDPTLNLKYRLKQIDNDGSYEYFDQIAEVNGNITSVEDDVLLTEFALHQNYPNPFNPSTTIQYDVPVDLDNSQFSIDNSQLVTLKVYDILGNEVATLVDEIKSPGKYSVNFDASSFASGTYIYKIVAGSFTDTKKMLIIK